MAMAAALVATLVPASRATTLSGPRLAIEQHASSSRASCVGRRPSWDLSSSDSAAASGLSSSGRDGRDGSACCSISSCSTSNAAAGKVTTACSTSTSRTSGRSHLGWRLGGSGGLDLSGLSAAACAGRRTNSGPRRLRIAAEKPDLANVAGTLLRIGKQGLEAGTNLVPGSVPRPVAQAGVGLAGVFLASFLLKSLFSTVTFILAIGAVSYAGYFFLVKGDRSSSSGKGGDGGDGSSGKPKSSDEALEEARKIMEKYK